MIAIGVVHGDQSKCLCHLFINVSQINRISLF